MKTALSSVLDLYRRYKAAKANSRAYRVLRSLLIAAVVAYVLLLSFPQVLFAHEISYRNLTEVGVNIQPILLGTGKPLFRPLRSEFALELIESEQISGGCIYALYRILS